MKIQIYEDYWKITNAYTNYNDSKFIGSLKTCLDYIDENIDTEYSTDKYTSLQLKIVSDNNITQPSARKVINQLVKMGFIKSFLLGYNKDSRNYIEAKTDRKRSSLLSKIVYSNASFNSSITNPSEEHQLNFLIKTLVENGKLSKSEIIALMLVDIGANKKGYLIDEELNIYLNEAISIGFIERKYNQIDYLINLLKKLDGLVFVEDDLYFIEDAKRIFGEYLDARILRKRDPYLHNIYKNQLQEESKEFFTSDEPKCMIEKVSYPVLIASHIKPFIKSDDREAYDPNNGLLLSRTVDSLFDLNYITFNQKGEIVFSNQLNDDVIEVWKDYKIPTSFLNNERLKYLEFHNTLLRK